jgi:hypothetical protein
MKKLAMLFFGLAAWPAAAVAQSALETTGPKQDFDSRAPVLERGIEDPRVFVEGMYRDYLDPVSGPEWPAYAYSDRLRALFDEYDAWQRQHDDVVGSLDFDYWINAQDWQLSNVSVTETAQDDNRRTEVARFTNVDRAEEIHFLFVRQGERWYLDDAVQGSGHGDYGWTLSELLRERQE